MRALVGKITSVCIEDSAGLLLLPLLPVRRTLCRISRCKVAGREEMKEGKQSKKRVRVDPLISRLYRCLLFNDSARSVCRPFLFCFVLSVRVGISAGISCVGPPLYW